MTASDNRKQRRAHLHSVSPDQPPRGGVVQESIAIEQQPKRQRQPLHFPTVTFGGVLHREPKKEKDLIDYASTASYWRGFAIGSVTMLLIGLFIGVAITHATQIMSIPITKETMEQGAMISRLFEAKPQ